MACFRPVLVINIKMAATAFCLLAVSHASVFCEDAGSTVSDAVGSKAEASVKSVEKQATGSPEKTETPERKVRPQVSADDRLSAMKFAAEHHPELARLLEQLQKSRPNEFARAVKELTQQIQQLERVREKNPARYAVQLEVWKQESQIRILMARWSRSKDVELEKQVRELLKKRREARLEQLKADRERLVEQQRRIDEQLAEAGGSMDAQVNKEWEQLSRRAGFGKQNVRKNAELPSASELRKK